MAVAKGGAEGATGFPSSNFNRRLLLGCLLPLSLALKCVVLTRSQCPLHTTHPSKPQPRPAITLPSLHCLVPGTFWGGLSRRSQTEASKARRCLARVCCRCCPPHGRITHTHLPIPRGPMIIIVWVPLLAHTHYHTNMHSTSPSVLPSTQSNNHASSPSPPPPPAAAAAAGGRLGHPEEAPRHRP